MNRLQSENKTCIPTDLIKLLSERTNVIIFYSSLSRTVWNSSSAFIRHGNHQFISIRSVPSAHLRNCFCRSVSAGWIIALLDSIKLKWPFGSRKDESCVVGRGCFQCALLPNANVKARHSYGVTFIAAG